MTVSKRVRYAVLQRDNYTCHYCGASAPDVKLHVDHVIPSALGGSDLPDNLVTACEACNSGKTSTQPADATVAAVNESAQRWAAAMQQAAQELADARAESRAVLDQWGYAWSGWKIAGTDRGVDLPDDWEQSLQAMLDAGAQLDTLIELVDVAMKSQARDTFRYFCGCAWNHVNGLRQRAFEILNGAPSTTPAGHLFDPHETAYWDGHVAGYNQGFEDGWDAGTAAGNRRSDPSGEPEPIATILRQLKEGPPDGEDPGHQA